MTAPAIECARCHTPVPVDARFCLVCGNEVSSPGVPPPRNAVDDLRDRLAEVLAGRYAIRRTLGVGGMGAVFLAEETGLEREVAIKVLPPRLAEDPSIVTRFEREAKTAARLDHSHIIPIYRVDSEGGLHYFVMKYVAGRALDTLLADRGQLPVPLTVRLLSESAAALEHAHRKGVVHRDIKPANILLDADDRVLLADFGIAKAVSVTGELTNTGVVIGTPYYMSPEQARGVPVDGRSDQYSLAVLGYRMLTGEPLFDGDSSMAILYKHINDPPPRVRDHRTDVPPEVDAAIQRALAKRREDRFPSMDAFARALRGEEPAEGVAPAVPAAEATLADGELTSAATVQLDTTPVPAGRRRWPWLALAGVLLAATATWRWYPRPALVPASPPPAASGQQAGAAPAGMPAAATPGQPATQPRDTAAQPKAAPPHR
ncbi:MAG TPA: serine/threonine-protein kinase, partial [Gemmatimonadales bacterium]|nr:serine/threonine-protein kinase [Gemmatimonadales bacterium]